jgi:hypothetical protein
VEQKLITGAVEVRGSKGIREAEANNQASHCDEGIGSWSTAPAGKGDWKGVE